MWNEKMSEPPFYDFDDFESGLDEDEFDFDDCGMMPDGLCSMAGSEWCDWECPHNRLPSPSPYQDNTNG